MTRPGRLPNIEALIEFLTSWVGTVMFCVIITAVFGIAWQQVSATLRDVRERNKELSVRLSEFASEERVLEKAGNHLAQEIREEMDAVVEAQSSIQMRSLVSRYQAEAARLEGSVGFWVDLLRQLGLLGTVLGLAFALLLDSSQADLLRPLALAVWTTVTGLALSIVLSAKFSDVTVDADNNHRYLELWQARLEIAWAKRGNEDGAA